MSAAVWPPTALRMSCPVAGLPARLGGVRVRLTRWCTDLGLPGRTVEDIVLATHEALANVADHAYRDRDGDSDSDRDGEAFLDAYCTTERVVVVVRDHGRWRPPAADPGWRGRGLQLIRSLTAQVRLERTAHGTTVEMHWPLDRSTGAHDSPHQER